MKAIRETTQNIQQLTEYYHLELYEEQKNITYQLILKELNKLKSLITNLQNE